MTSSSWQFDSDLAIKVLGKFILGFGRKNVTADRLLAVATSLSDEKIIWSELDQTHSATVIHAAKANPYKINADAHFSFERGLALVVKTADCIPALLYAPPSAKHPSGVIAAVHAGWRGIENEILVHTLQRLKREGVDVETLNVAIGPHIGYKSFEVDLDIAERLTHTALRAGFKKDDRDFPVAPSPYRDSKCLVNLSQIAIGQLTREGVKVESIELLKEAGEVPDTKTDLTWSSFRRDGAAAGRNYSFVLIT
jgi:polyphenol oxidase